MHVKLFATYRRDAGCDALDIEAGTAGEVREALAERFGERFRAPGAILLVDGVNVQLLQGDDTPISADARVELFPPLGGG